MTTSNHKLSMIGDAAHLLVMTNSLIFAYAVVFHNSSPIFDPIWRPGGFCVMNQDIPFFNSHDLCLYADTVGSLVVGLLYWSLKDQPGMNYANDLIKSNIIGIFAHGVAHEGISKSLRDGDAVSSLTLFEILNSAPIQESALQLGGLSFFWAALLKSAMPTGSFKTIIPVVIGSAIVHLFVPPQFVFTFVQTVLLIASSLNQIMYIPKEKKGSAVYALFPLMVPFPLCCIGWLESTQCSNFVINIGGHLVYDAYIPFSVICFYLICYNLSKKDHSQGRDHGKIKAA